MANSYTNTALLDRNHPRKVVFYGRVSTEHEAQLSALENQMEWYEDIAKRYPNWTVVDKYIDEGITGTQAKKRPSFMKMIEDSKTEKFDLIVTREVCRFARNTVDTLTHTRALRSREIEVYFVDDNIWTMDGDGELRLTIMATLAQEESRKVSERVKAGQHISRQNGTLYGCGNILGYNLKRNIDEDGKWNPSENTYVINSEQAETVRMIFDLYEQGNGEKKISSELCRLHRKSANGDIKWDASKIGRILKNATYRGYICYNKSRNNNYLEQKRIKNHDIDTYTLVKGDFEPIVSEEQWNRCDKIRRSKVTAVSKNGKKVLYGKRSSKDVFLRKLKCKCGSPFRKNKWRKNKSGEEAYGYQCYNQLNNGSKSFREKNGLDTEGYCDEKMIADWKLEIMAKEVLGVCWETRKEDAIEAFRLIKHYLLNEQKSENTELITINNSIEKLNKRLENMIAMRADGELTKEEYAKSKTKIENEISVLQKKKENFSEDNAPANRIDLDKIQAALDTLTEIGNPNSYIIDNFVDEIRPLGNNRFAWVVRLSGDTQSDIICSVGGRKNNSSVSIEGVSPLTYDFCFFDLRELQKTCPSGGQYRLLLRVSRSSDTNTSESAEIAISWTFVIDYETAKAYRKRNGGYLRQNQWKDITVEVRVS